jgi:metal-responsive CopG/Arc/MetJ family transcriptional regulator
LPQEDTLEDIDQEASEHGDTRSEYIRDVLETRVEHENEHGDGECIPIDEHERLQQEHDEL